MSVESKMEVYYDASCPICEAEIDELRRADVSQRLDLVDCSSSAFADVERPDGQPDQGTLMRALHVKTDQGWVAGPAAFSKIYQSLGMTRMAALWGSARLRPLVNLVYRLFVVTRPLLARLGLARVVRWVVRREVARAQR